ncbi:Hypothetical predicted protein, partial [Marmota monax]
MVSTTTSVYSLCITFSMSYHASKVKESRCRDPSVITQPGNATSGSEISEDSPLRMGAHQGDFVVMKSWLCLGVDPAEVNGVKPVKDEKRNAKANTDLREAPSFLDPVRQ